MVLPDHWLPQARVAVLLEASVMATRGRKGAKRAAKREKQKRKVPEYEQFMGPQPDRPGKCNAVLSIGDDYGDNSATMKCQLDPGHEGRHEEVWNDGDCRVEWR